jgi:hypothetical protein
MEGRPREYTNISSLLTEFLTTDPHASGVVDWVFYSYVVSLRFYDLSLPKKGLIDCARPAPNCQLICNGNALLITRDNLYPLGTASSL